MKIYLGADHAGFQLKEVVKEYLEEQEFEIKDFGAFSLNGNDDYPDFIRPVAEAVSQDSDNNRGIIIGGSGQGEAMTANRFSGVRAIVYYGPPASSKDNVDTIIALSRQHNNANVLALGARFITAEEAKRAIHLWLHTSFDGGRHARRIEKIDNAS